MGGTASVVAGTGAGVESSVAVAPIVMAETVG